MSNKTDYVAACEAILTTEISNNTKNHIYPGISMIAEALLSRRVEMHDAYHELHSKLGSWPRGLWTFFDGLLTAANFWNLQELTAARETRSRLQELNAHIAINARVLAELLKLRSELNGQNGFFSDTHDSAFGLIVAAGRGNPNYESYVSDEVRKLNRFGSKYWPSLSDIMHVLADDAAEATVEATDSMTAAGTSSIRASQADFFRSWFKAIADCRENGDLPENFELSDSSYASLANCALKLDVKKLIDAAYIKRLRQRDRGLDKGK